MNDHAPRPRDRADLYLAPVALTIDERLEELGALDDKALEKEIVFSANVDLSKAGARQQGLETAVGYLVDLHDWSLELVPRGVRLSHSDHALVLGLPDNCRRFLDQGQ